MKSNTFSDRIKLNREITPSLTVLDRAAADDSCKAHVHYSIGMTFRCAVTGVCLSRLTDTLNGRCDCCSNVPDGDCSKCNDHSDEGRYSFVSSTL